uniref:CRAL-TRIO domain-containing protein n=1 Tax=Acrobeloides nanus TaxID=290746 RepID=A0A914EA08_9BILA
MQNVNIIDYINPYSSINKLFQSRVQLWFDYYGEVLKHAILINPPTFLSALIQVMSIILPEKLLSRFIFIHNEPYDILPYLTVEAIPTFCGGSKEISVLPISRKIDREEYIMEGEIWSEHNIIEVPYEEITINTSKTFVTTLQVKSGQTLLYEYFASRDYEISCVHEKQGILIPRLKMSSPVVPEEGSFYIKEDGEIKLEITNLSKMLKMKLKIALLIV